MIHRPTCECCGCLIHPGHRRCFHCLTLPSPAEIAARSAEVQAGWSDAERAKRAGCPHQHVVAPVFPDDIFGPLVR